MLEIQRWKTYTEADLRAEGLTDQEIRSVQTRQIGAFRPAFENGRRKNQREADGTSFYERMHNTQRDLQANRSAQR